jgi:hypothetical protein
VRDPRLGMRGGGGDDDVGGADELLFRRVEVAHIDHHDAIGRQRRFDVRALAPAGIRQARADRHRHTAEHARAAGFWRVEIAVGVEPDQADARGRAVGVL